MNPVMRFLRGRPSTTDSTALLWAKSLLNAVLFFSVFMVSLPWMAHHLVPTVLPLPPALRTWGGVILCTVGLGLWILCLDAFSRRGRGTPLPTDAPRYLVADGPFAVVRNPLITAELMVAWGIAITFASAGLLGYAVLLTVASHWVVVRVEEPELHKRFGERYESYCREVPRWIPRLGVGKPATKGTVP